MIFLTQRILSKQHCVDCDVIGNYFWFDDFEISVIKTIKK